MTYEELRRRRAGVKWRDVFAHNSTRVCRRCRHFTSSHRFCTKTEMLTLPEATCRQFSLHTKPRKPLNDEV